MLFLAFVIIILWWTPLKTTLGDDDHLLNLYFIRIIYCYGQLHMLMVWLHIQWVKLQVKIKVSVIDSLVTEFCLCDLRLLV